MKFNVVIPMAGESKRFISNNYLQQKSLLPVNESLNILQSIFRNFDKKNTRYFLILSDKNLADNIKLIFKNYSLKIIIIKKNEKGPLNSIILAKNILKKSIPQTGNIFISYSDIIWKWNFKRIVNFVKNKTNVVFTHTGFHPHLEINKKADFCISNKNIITKVKKKNFFGDDYKNNYLAIGCYYFKNFQSIYNLLNNEKYSILNNEIYIVDLIKNLLKKKEKVYSYLIKHFVHLGFPSQYEDFLLWRNYFKDKSNKLISNNHIFYQNNTVVLAGGKGSRTKSITPHKILIKLRNKLFLNQILGNFGTKKNTIIINDKSLIKKLSNKKLNYYKISKTNSMFDTIIKSRDYLKGLRNFFLTSCDCVGNFDFFTLRQTISENNPDIVFFGFNHTNLQKNLNKSHSLLDTNNKIVKNIYVKNKYLKNYYGHSGFFWINQGSIFEHIEQFQKSDYFKNLKREVLLDDYFKYLTKNRIVKSYWNLLNNYIHIGSYPEYYEYCYWENFFKITK